MSEVAQLPRGAALLKKAARVSPVAKIRFVEAVECRTPREAHRYPTNDGTEIPSRQSDPLLDGTNAVHSGARLLLHCLLGGSMGRKMAWRIGAVVVLSVAVFASVAYANDRSWRFVYYSDSTYTTEVGMVFWPAVCCDPYIPYEEGTTGDYRKKYVYFDEFDCEGTGQASVICQRKINGAWYSVSCS